MKNAEKIYVRGKDKAIFLQELTTIEVINLEEDDERSPFVKLTWMNTYCLYHVIKPCHLALNCALNNAAIVKYEEI